MNSGGSFTKCPVGTVGGELSKNSKVSFTKYLPGTWVSTFKKYSLCACWVLGGHFVSELTMNSPCACWVNALLPPVSISETSNNSSQSTSVSAPSSGEGSRPV